MVCSDLRVRRTQEAHGRAHVQRKARRTPRRRQPLARRRSSCLDLLHLIDGLLSQECCSEGDKRGDPSATPLTTATIAGITISVSRVEDTIPPIIGTAIRCITSAPVPLLHMIGRSPAMMAATVIIFGRTRSTAPASIAA